MSDATNLQNQPPRSEAASLLFATIVSAMVGVIAVGAGTLVAATYGLALFLLTPMVMGFLAAVLHGWRAKRTFWASAAPGMLAVLLAAVLLLFLAMEGAICLVMAAPLAFAMSLLGSAFGFGFQIERWKRISSRVSGCVVLMLPVAIGLETAADREAPLLRVETSVIVNAPPETVWRNVVSFSELPEPDEWIFRLGVAYPVKAGIDGTGPGAIRRCMFSTGAFVEPIEVWEEPSLLCFTVTENPAPLEEWTPYAHVHPPHVDGFLVSERGQFRLVRLADGTTQLEGTTWYRHHMWPVAYWQLWSDMIIHRIHLRVLNHIKTLSEAPELERQRAVHG